MLGSEEAAVYAAVQVRETEKLQGLDGGGPTATSLHDGHIDPRR
jgi:hypothetical protein